MARPIRVTLSSQTESAPITINNLGNSPVNIGLGVALSAGAGLTYTVEFTYDDITLNTFSPATATWFPFSGLTALTTAAASSATFPLVALRLRVSAYTSGSATLTVVQANQ